MKFIPILFSTAMVQALQAGRKTQTRRVVKPQPIDNTEVDGNFFEGNYKGFVKVDGHPDWQRLFAENHGPYKKGDVLWVRETWAKFDTLAKAGIEQEFIYRSLGESIPGLKWKPSIFMPKAAARIFLKIKDIRVERLQAISEADAIAEGVEKYHDTGFYKMYGGKRENDWVANAYASYAYLWESINGPESWDVNPWVWVVEFEQIEKPEGFL